MNNAESCQAFQVTLRVTGPFTLGAHTRVWECRLLVVAPDVELARSFARLYATSLFSDDVAVKIVRSRRVVGSAFSAPYPQLLAGRANLMGEREAAPVTVQPSKAGSLTDQS